VYNWLKHLLKPPPNIWENVIHVIYPYKWVGFWVFDDERVGLSKEAFISGADTFIDLGLFRLGIDDGHLGFRAIFSAVPFPEHQFTLVHSGKERYGNTYTSKELDVKGWLCPALGRYFKNPPKAIYIKFEQLPPDLQKCVNPNPQPEWTGAKKFLKIQDVRDSYLDDLLDGDDEVLLEIVPE
jgi:hypothetical protein